MENNSTIDDSFSKALVTLKFFQGKYSEVFKHLEVSYENSKLFYLEAVY